MDVKWFTPPPSDMSIAKRKAFTDGEVIELRNLKFIVHFTKRGLALREVSKKETSTETRNEHNSTPIVTVK